MIERFHVSVIGARHIQEDMPCQDYAVSICEKDFAAAIVCDGHGGKPFFRSDMGAKFAAEATIESIRRFAKSVDRTAFTGKAYQAFSASGKSEKGRDVHAVVQLFRPLFASIIKLWQDKIRQHILENPFTTEEEQCVPEFYREYFDNMTIASSAYGTTLVAYIQCKSFWFTFQIGDGALVIFQDEFCGMPIPLDPNCHDNITTSLCDPKALDEFRFYVDGSGTFPSIAFACTDGMQKCFKSDEKLGEYLFKMGRILELGTKEVLQEQMQTLLPKFSQLTSGDDISIACIYNKNK